MAGVWTRHGVAGTGQVYYFNMKLNKSSWYPDGIEPTRATIMTALANTAATSDGSSAIPLQQPPPPAASAPSPSTLLPTASQVPVVANQFSNDGSFIEQMKKKSASSGSVNPHLAAAVNSIRNKASKKMTFSLKKPALKLKSKKRPVPLDASAQAFAKAAAELAAASKSKGAGSDSAVAAGAGEGANNQSHEPASKRQRTTPVHEEYSRERGRGDRQEYRRDQDRRYEGDRGRSRYRDNDDGRYRDRGRDRHHDRDHGGRTHRDDYDYRDGGSRGRRDEFGRDRRDQSRSRRHDRDRDDDVPMPDLKLSYLQMVSQLQAKDGSEAGGKWLVR